MMWPRSNDWGIHLILHPAYGSRSERLHGKIETQLDAGKSAFPGSPCSMARILPAEGVDPQTLIVTRHAGADSDPMISTVGEAAKRTVEESSTLSPTFRRWKPCPARSCRPYGRMSSWSPGWRSLRRGDRVADARAGIDLSPEDLARKAGQKGAQRRFHAPKPQGRYTPSGPAAKGRRLDRDRWLQRNAHYLGACRQALAMSAQSWRVNNGWPTRYSDQCRRRSQRGRAARGLYWRRHARRRRVRSSAAQRPAMAA
jgi:hypothetical protein